MIPVTHRKGETLYVFGLGKTGLSAINALICGGSRVLAWDDRDETRRAAGAAGAELVEPENLDWAQIDALVLSPGVPLTHPEPHQVVQLARQHSVPIIGDTELFVNEVRATMEHAKIIAITGTNGKSTTTVLLGHILASAGVETEVGGNLGSSAVLELKPAVNHNCYVIEFSSYQIDLTPSLRPDVAIFLNLSPDHIDRHGSFEGYGAVKAKIFARQGEGDTLVLGMDDASTMAMSGKVPHDVKLVPVSQDHAVGQGIYCLGGDIFDARSGPARLVTNIEGVGSLRGAHNRQNACAATAAALTLGVEPHDIAKGLRSFGGLEHRMEEVGRVGKVLLINDSKATNADSAQKALASFDAIFWIAGGRAKAEGIEPLAQEFDRVAKAYLIGEAAANFAATLGKSVPHLICKTLDVAVTRAFADAQSSDAAAPVVLLSPACASFDQFANFESRGEAFRDSAMTLISKNAQTEGEP